MRALGLSVTLIALAGCDEGSMEGGDSGLFEPWMFNDVAYDATFVGVSPVTDAALLDMGFTASREIRITRMTDPFSPDDAAEADAVAASFCGSGALTFVPDAEGIQFEEAGFVFPLSCFESAG